MIKGKLVIIRGHSGSGKSTMAQCIIDSWAKDYGTQAHITWEENDKHMINEQGEYDWSIEKVRKAKDKVHQNLLKAIKNSKHKKYPLIIISSVNDSRNFYDQLIDRAVVAGLEVEICRLLNFNENIHNVPEEHIINQYVSLDKNPLPGEIKIGVVDNSLPIMKRINSVKNFSRKNLKINPVNNSYVTDEYLKNTATKKLWYRNPSKKYPELSVLKYTKQVHFNNLWDNALLEMRGLIVDQYGNIIVRPFNKVFNLSEHLDRYSKYPLNLEELKQAKFYLVRKVNGYLGVITYVELPKEHGSYGSSFNKKIIYSTTGSTDSWFAQTLEREVEKRPNIKNLVESFPNYSFMFEVCVPEDKHIIDEKEGLYLIGCRNVQTGEMIDERVLDGLAKTYQVERYQTDERLISPYSYEEILERVKKVTHEGYMVFSDNPNIPIFKIKSNYYLISKFLGRCTEKNIGNKLNKQHFDEEFYPVVHHINNEIGLNNFLEMEEQERIALIRNKIESIYKGAGK